jgi:hypothetical protein
MPPYFSSPEYWMPGFGESSASLALSALLFNFTVASATFFLLRFV